MSQHADSPACGTPVPWTSTALRALRAMARPRRAGAGDGRAGLAPGVVLVVATGFVVGAVAGTTAVQIERDSAYAAEVAARAAFDAHVLRVDEAASERLSAQGTAYLAQRRTHALAEAQTVVAEAGVLTAAVGPVVDAETLAPLDEALSAIKDLVHGAPAAPTVILTATALVAAERPAVVPTEATVSPTTPGADVLSLVAQTRSQGATSPSASSPSPAPEQPTEADATVTAPVPTGGTTRSGDPTTALQDLPSTAPSDVPSRSVATDSASAAPSAGPSLGKAASSLPADTRDSAKDAAPTVPSPVVAQGPPTLGDTFVLGTSVVPRVVAASAVAAASADGLDIATSQRILTLVEEIRSLSTQVQARADEVIAEQKAAAEARAAAEAEAQAAAARAARTMAGRVAAAKAAPNGNIPEVLLCSVSFSSTALLRCDAAAALEQMNSAYRQETGKRLVLSSAYRTTSQQEVLRESKGDLAALPGTSNHGRGIAIDLAGAGLLGQFDAPLYLWLVDHAGIYGWFHPPYMDPGGSGPLEPWHWEFGTN